jgi:uncharacterized membrane protein
MLSSEPVSIPQELQATTHGGTEEEEHERLQRLTDETTQEIRQSMQFTMGQCLAAIVVYLLVGVLTYTLLLEPSWTFIDSLYFTVTTISTVGYGDLTPTTVWSRNFTALFALGGVSCLGVVLGIVGSNLMDRQAHAMETTLHSNRAPCHDCVFITTIISGITIPHDRRNSINQIVHYTIQ